MQEGPEVEADLLADQRAFYRARAPEYDEWWRRRDRYDRGPDDAAEWDRQIQQVTNAADQFGRLGDVLELAGGTGWWSRHLAQKAASLAVIDSSDETLSINRQRVGRTHVTYIVADIFTWRPDRHYDTVFFSFWLSHVPRELFEAFWALVSSCLRPGGRVFLIDNRRDPTRTALDPYVIDEADYVQRRQLSDGSEHRVVKVSTSQPSASDSWAGIPNWSGRRGSSTDRSHRTMCANTIAEQYNSDLRVVPATRRIRSRRMRRERLSSSMSSWTLQYRRGPQPRPHVAPLRHALLLDVATERAVALPVWRTLQTTGAGKFALKWNSCIFRSIRS
jgi:SAM-dependent methyltransferase